MLRSLDRWRPGYGDIAMRFLADMGVSPRTVEWLRSLGHDAIHLIEQKLHKLSDRDVLCKAKTENRILITMDLDFAQLVASAGIKNLFLIVILRLNDQRPQNVHARLSAIMETLENITENAVISVDENKIRVRQLPILSKRNE